MSTDVTKIIGGPAKVTYGGVTIYSKADITQNLSIETFAIETDRFQQVDERVSQTPCTLSFTPIGILADLLALFAFYAQMPLGDLITPVRTLGTVDTSGNSVAIVGHKLRDGMAVEVSTDNALPAPLAVKTLYYLHVIDADNVSFHASRDDALDGANAIDLTTAGTGTHKLIMQEPLVIHTVHGKKITFWNTAITQLPQLLPGATRTILGDITFESFLRNDRDAEEDNAFFTIEDVPYTDDEFDPAAIITQCYGAEWGTGVWADFATKTGFTIDFALTLEPVETDCQGVLTRRLTGIAVTAKAQPVGISESDLMDKLLIQGAGAKRGRSLAGDNLNITGDGVYIRLYGAALVGGPQSFGSKTDRIGELEWRATRTFASGVPNPLSYIGVAAPV